MYVRVSGLRTVLAGAWLLVWLGVSGPAAARECFNVSDALRASQSAIDVAETKAFYDAIGARCVWDNESAQALLTVLQGAGDHGLDPATFHADDAAGATADVRDVLLTDGALRYAAAMRGGSNRVRPKRIDRAYSKTEGEFAGGLVNALANNDVAEWLDSLPPQSDAYAQLVEALRKYRALEAAGGFPELPDRLVTGPRWKSRNYAMLRQRLALEGDIGFDDGSWIFEETLQDGVRRFQERNGLQVTSRVNWKTLKQLNVPAQARAEQIALSLERLRRDENETPETRVEVNIPAATATLFRNGVPVLSMNAVVGAPDHATPTLSSTIDTIILNPTWTIPESIIANEILPKLKRQRNYLRRNRMYWSGDQLIQEPGPHNSLGRIKFDFPNKYSVYLHDTPARALFTSPERAQSHGCVRLQHPLDLAAALLEGSKWDRGSLQDAIDNGATKRIAVPDPMPVVIVYRTVFIGDDGAVNFRPDVYGLDEKFSGGLAQRAAKRA